MQVWQTRLSRLSPVLLTQDAGHTLKKRLRCLHADLTPVDHEVLGISSCLLRAPVFLYQNLGTQQYRNPLVILGGLADFVHKLLRVGTEKWCAVRKVYKLPEP